MHAAADLRRFRDKHRLTVRKAAAIADVAHPTWLRYEHGQFPVPAKVSQALDAFNALHLPAERETILQAVESAGELTWSELEARVPGSTRAARRLIAEGALAERTMVRVDAGRRHRTLRGISRPEEAVSSRVAPIDAAELRISLDQLGWTPKRLAVAAGVATTTVRLWLASKRPIPPTRGEHIRSVLRVSGGELRAARLSAGWKLNDVARRFGRHLAQVSHWERGDRQIPTELQGVARTVVRDAALDARRENSGRRGSVASPATCETTRS
jgi:transcriptional regulator with XRE-family HTH domain